MAQIIIDIPDAQVSRVLEAFTQSFGYVEDGSQTKAQFAKKQVANWIKGITLSYERQKAAQALTDTPIDVT